MKSKNEKTLDYFVTTFSNLHQNPSYFEYPQQKQIILLCLFNNDFQLCKVIKCQEKLYSKHLSDYPKYPYFETIEGMTVKQLDESYCYLLFKYNPIDNILLQSNTWKPAGYFKKTYNIGKIKLRKASANGKMTKIFKQTLYYNVKKIIKKINMENI